MQLRLSHYLAKSVSFSHQREKKGADGGLAACCLAGVGGGLLARHSPTASSSSGIHAPLAGSRSGMVLV